MSSRNVLESQQSVHASQAGRAAAGCWKLVTGRALSLRPRRRSVLEIAQGSVWLTLGGSRGGLPGAVADQVLVAGECLVVEAGQHVVIEDWSLPGAADAVAFHWSEAVAEAPQAASAAARDWECGVVQPLRDLAQALGQGGRALGTAVAAALAAGGRFMAGLARFALHRIAAPLQRTTV